MRQISSAEIRTVALSALGLDPAAESLASTEAIAASLRRVAGFLCPCSASTLVRTLLQAMKGLVEDLADLKVRIEETLDAMVGYGDLHEMEEVSYADQKTKGRLLYLAPPSFVTRESFAVLLIGIVPDQLSPLPEEMEKRIECFNHVRKINEIDGEDLKADLTQLGLIELSMQTWLEAPKKESAAEYLQSLDNLLDASPQSGELLGLMILDPSLPVKYYRGRWKEPKSLSGRFIARRKQAYGADLWCYVELENGNACKMLDFPSRGSTFRGCDEAWRLQAAIDAHLGTPQLFRLRPGTLRSTTIVDFFSPVPMWARRRFDFIGEVAETERCLFSYEFSLSEIKEELKFIKDYLWLSETKE